MSAGQVHVRIRAAGGQGRPARPFADFRLGDGRVPGVPGLLLLAAGARRRRVRIQSDTAYQSGRVHQHVRAGIRAHTGGHDRRAVQPGIQRSGDRHRVRARVPHRVLRRQDLPEPAEHLRARHHVRHILRVLFAGHRVRVVHGAGDQEQDAAGDPDRARWQEEAQPVAKRDG